MNNPKCVSCGSTLSKPEFHPVGPMPVYELDNGKCSDDYDVKTEYMCNNPFCAKWGEWVHVKVWRT